MEVYQREFDTAANQDNYGLDQITTEWLSLDADYLLTDEVDRRDQEPQASGFGQRLLGEIQILRVRQDVARLALPAAQNPVPPRKGALRGRRAHSARARGRTNGVALFIRVARRQKAAEQVAEVPRPLTCSLKWRNCGKRRATTRPGRRDAPEQDIAPFAVMFYCLIISKGHIGRVGRLVLRAAKDARNSPGHSPDRG